MHPKDFKEYWQLTNSELAELLGFSVDGVNHWFRQEKPADPPQSIQIQLDLWHVQFLTWQNEEAHLLLQARDIYQKSAQRRRKRKNKD